VVIHPRKAQIFEGLLPEFLQELTFRLSGGNRAGLDAVEELPDFAWCHLCNRP
jgi:hypothetical protein